jgi:hypothetical protein
MKSIFRDTVGLVFDKCFATMGDLAMNKKFGALKAFIAATR